MTVESFAAVVPALQGAVSIYSPGTAHHASRVGEMAATMATALRLSEPEVEMATWAGLLHDVGKLSVPIEVLGKTGSLTEADWQQIWRHPGVGSDLVLAISPELTTLAVAIRAHHERWDGDGYPDRLRGARIPLTGRIVALVDAFDAMTHGHRHRPSGRSPAEAVAELERCAGSQFDPALVRLFRSLQREGAFLADHDR